MKFRSPARHLGIDCKGIDQCPVAKAPRIPLSDDRRVFTSVARSSYVWKDYYDQRSALEPVNSRFWLAHSGSSGRSFAAAAAGSGMYTQSPFLDARVASGELPPVEDRLPIEPMVRQVLDEIGTYGGRLTIFSHEHPNPHAPMVGDNPEGGPAPIWMDLEGSVEPGLAKGWDMPDDYMSFTLYLREGAKWSNGDPFTAEDFTFFYYELQLKDLGTVWGLPSQVTSGHCRGRLHRSLGL